jgi:hypothetical protein
MKRICVVCGSTQGSRRELPRCRRMTFLQASLVQDMRDPKNILIYEVWNESPESFMKDQMTKTYRAEFEKI